MIRKEENITFPWCPDKVFVRIVSDTYKIREIATGNVYDHAVNYELNIEDYEETDIPLVIEPIYYVEENK